MHGMPPLAVVLSLAVGCVLSVSAPGRADETTVSKPAGEKTASKFVDQTLRGRVVWHAEALHRRYGIQPAGDATERSLALEATDGRLYPLVEDVRGRAFRRDERLRKMDLELLVRSYAGAGAVQVIGVWELKDAKKYELDYWCDICAIAMYELKPCDCCQGETRLRRREVAASKSDAQKESSVPDRKSKTGGR